MADGSEATPEFDFNAHRVSAVIEYRKLHPIYVQFTQIAKNLVTDILDDAHIKYHSIQARAKEIDEFGRKAAKPSESDPAKPKYANPLKEITDMAGVRVITFLPRTLRDVCRIIEQQFTVLEYDNKTEKLLYEGKFGYQSVHYLVRMHQSRTHLPEYKPYSSLILEIQIRTLLQHAWAEMEHDIQYKSVIDIPILIRRRFEALAALLDIADLEFQTLQDEYERKRQKKDKDIDSYIELLFKAIAEGNRDYADEALRDLSLQLEYEKRDAEQDLEASSHATYKD